MDTRKKGQRAEQEASLFLEKKGLRVLTRNYHCRVGEVDLIMQDGNEIVFVEVRMRFDSSYGSALESVTYVKQRKLIYTAQHYLQTKGLLDKVPCRFDIVSIGEGKMDWIKNAFFSDDF